MIGKLLNYCASIVACLKLDFDNLVAEITKYNDDRNDMAHIGDHILENFDKNTLRRCLLNLMHSVNNSNF